MFYYNRHGHTGQSGQLYAIHSEMLLNIFCFVESGIRLDIEPWEKSPFKEDIQITLDKVLVLSGRTFSFLT